MSHWALTTSVEENFDEEHPGSLFPHVLESSVLNVLELNLHKYRAIVQEGRERKAPAPV